jgi:hypothetical protein
LPTEADGMVKLRIPVHAFAITLAMASCAKVETKAPSSTLAGPQLSYQSSNYPDFVAQGGDCLHAETRGYVFLYRRSNERCDAGDRSITDAEAALAREGRLLDLASSQGSVGGSLRERFGVDSTRDPVFVPRAGDCLWAQAGPADPIIYRKVGGDCNAGDRRVTADDIALHRQGRLSELRPRAPTPAPTVLGSRAPSKPLAVERATLERERASLELERASVERLRREIERHRARPPQASTPNPAVDAAAIRNEKRVALVVGNGDYRGLGRLKNPTNDARAMASSLRRLGFDVVALEDATLRQMTEAIQAFGDRIPRGGVGLFYYAGHAIQAKGANYLIPVDSALRSETELDYLAVNAGLAMAQFDRAGGRVNVAILDSCRDNPLQSAFRSASRGLAVLPTAPGGTLVIYATSPNEVAADGDGSNGLFTGELLRNIEMPGLKIEDLFKRVAAGVQTRSHGRQRPWISGTGILGDFYFHPPG